MSLYLIQHPGETRLALIVEVVDNASAHVQELKARMFESSCAHGIVLDDRDTIVLRDMFTGVDASSIQVDFKLDTAPLVGESGDLDTRVRRWLHRMSANWRATLDGADPTRQQLIYDIVPALSGAVINQADGNAA